MINRVTDSSGNRHNKIANAARVIGRSRDRLKVFKAIYSGKKTKTANEILKKTDLKNRVRILQEGAKLSSEDIVIKTKKKGIVLFIKIDFYNHNKNRIISLVNNKPKLDKFLIEKNPHTRINSYVNIKLKNQFKIFQITIDDIDSFSKISDKKINNVKNIYENKIKYILKKILDEKGEFTDWGGEKNDLYSTKLKLNGKRISVAFGLKGKGTKGRLTPKKMGKNGDQIQRLFLSSADVFLIQYVDQIDESIIEQMKINAIAKSLAENKKIYYGVIDGEDTSRLISAYNK